MLGWNERLCRYLLRGYNIGFSPCWPEIYGYYHILATVILIGVNYLKQR
jgi:hypothetical protein